MVKCFPKILVLKILRKENRASLCKVEIPKNSLTLETTTQKVEFVTTSLSNFVGTQKNGKILSFFNKQNCYPFFTAHHFSTCRFGESKTWYKIDDNKVSLEQSLPATSTDVNLLFLQQLSSSDISEKDGLLLQCKLSKELTACVVPDPNRTQQGLPKDLSKHIKEKDGDEVFINEHGCEITYSDLKRLFTDHPTSFEKYLNDEVLFFPW